MAVTLTADPLIPIVCDSNRHAAGSRRSPPAPHPIRAGVLMDVLDTQALEEKIDRLIHVCNNLADENRSLHEQVVNLMAERAALIEKGELARSRIEAMIQHMRAIESGT